MSEEKINISTVDQKITVIVSLLLRIANEGKKLTLKDQVKDLSSFGLSYIEIATILGKKASHISKELSELKKTK